MPIMFKSQASTPTMAQTIRHLAAYRLASISFSRIAASSGSTVLFECFVSLLFFKGMPPSYNEMNGKI